MKCEKCNEREATFFYSANINGKGSQRHLCADCAREEGFGEMLSPAGMFDNAFGSFFDDFLSPAGRFLSMPAFDMFGGGLRSIMAPSLPRLRFVVDNDRAEAKSPVMEESETKIPDTVDESVRLEREKCALKAQLHDAVAAEDYEKAIILRDKLRELEK